MELSYHDRRSWVFALICFAGAAVYFSEAGEIWLRAFGLLGLAGFAAVARAGLRNGGNRTAVLGLEVPACVAFSALLFCPRGIQELGLAVFLGAFGLNIAQWAWLVRGEFKQRGLCTRGAILSVTGTTIGLMLIYFAWLAGNYELGMIDGAGRPAEYPGYASVVRLFLQVLLVIVPLFCATVLHSINRLLRPKAAVPRKVSVAPMALPRREFIDPLDGAPLLRYASGLLQQLLLCGTCLVVGALPVILFFLVLIGTIFLLYIAGGILAACVPWFPRCWLAVFVPLYLLVPRESRFWRAYIAVPSGMLLTHLFVYWAQRAVWTKDLPYADSQSTGILYGPVLTAMTIFSLFEFLAGSFCKWRFTGHREPAAILWRVFAQLR